MEFYDYSTRIIGRVVEMSDGLLFDLGNGISSHLRTTVIAQNENGVLLNIPGNGFIGYDTFNKYFTII